MVCTTCGTENPPEAEYCSNCGVPLSNFGGHSESGHPVVYCTNCGAENLHEARSCNSCGTQIQVPPGRVTVVSEPQPQASVEYMGFWIRLAAQILDDIILGVAVVVVSILAAFLPLFAILYIPLLIYWLYSEIKCRTPGRRLLGMKVVNESGEEISFWRGALRAVIGKTVSGIFLYLGFVWVAFDSKKQGWHDKIAGTYVIKRA